MGWLLIRLPTVSALARSGLMPDGSILTRHSLPWDYPRADSPVEAGPTAGRKWRAKVSDEMYGRTELEWEALEAAGWDFLISQARESRPATDYTEMNNELATRTSQPPWDFGYAKDRAAMGELLGRLVDRSYAETKDRPGGGLMISALVMFLGGNGVGRGFYGKAVKLNLIPSERMSEQAKDAFWIGQMNGIVEWAALH
jgi:hypothetical protein